MTENQNFWDQAFNTHVLRKGNEAEIEATVRAIELNKAIIGAQSGELWDRVRTNLRASMDADLTNLGQGTELSLDRIRFLQGRIFVYENILTDQERLLRKNEELQQRLDELTKNGEDSPFREPLPQGAIHEG